MTSSPQPLAALRDVTKRFGKVTVLDGVSFEMWPGEVHILAGENGAGKSTLMKILAGIHTDFEGQIEIGGAPVRFRSPLDAAHHGIAVIHQELSLIGSMSVADNLFLGRTKTTFGWIHDGDQAQLAAEWLERLGLNIDPRRPVEEFSIATQQCIEIAKALSQEAKVIVMDEPTSALSGPEAERLFELIAQLKNDGCAIVYISHKMDEIERIADRITVLRDGKYIGTAPAAELPTPELIRWMVGREVGEQFPRHASTPGEVQLRVQNFSLPGGPGKKPLVDDVSLELRRGEILGLGGLQGSGASELLMGLFGALPGGQGRLELDGRTITIRSPRQAIEQGLALLTNDRKGNGLVLPMSIVANASLASLRKLSYFGWRQGGRERQAAREVTQSLRLRAASLNMPVGELSGGNQQKVAIAKWLETDPSVLLLDEPTRGIDIGAKREIYTLMDEWTSRGISILLITSEMPELLALSDRILVMHRGRVTAEFSRSEATSDAILAAAMGSTGARATVH
jgi:ABC-type sugar transport system ATPase subunit